MAASPEIVVKYIADTSALQKGIGDVQGAGAKAGLAAKKAFLPAVAALGGVAVGAKKAMDAASDLNESVNAVEVTFGKASKQVLDFSKVAATEAGLSMSQFNELVTPVGAALQNTGMSADEAAKASINLAKRAADMASVFNTDVADAMGAIQAGLRGEADPLERFGVGLSDAAVKAKAMAMGLAESEKALTAQDKAQARMALLMQQTTKFQGDFKNTSDSAANSQRILAAEMENLQASLGQALLPAMQMFMGILREVVGFMSEHQTATKAAVVAVTALATAVVAVNVAMKAWAAIQLIAKAATLAATAAQWLFNAAMTANPIGLVVVAIAALIAAIVLLVKNWDTVTAVMTKGFELIKAAALTVFNWIKSNWPLLVAILTGPIGVAVLAIVKNWDKIEAGAKAVLDWIKKNWPLIVAVLTGPIGIAVATIIKKWDEITEGINGVVDAIRTAVGKIPGIFLGIVGSVGNAIGRVVDAIKRPINALISAWNGLAFQVPSITIPGFDGVKVAGKTIVPGWGGTTIGGGSFPFPKIPLLARGGVIDRPTLAMVGEGAGREIVTPEALLRSIIDERPLEVRVFLGNEELKGLVRTEIVRSNTDLARTLIAGSRG
jgi:hypothetical protein